MQKFLCSRPALNEETFPFFTKRLGTTKETGEDISAAQPGSTASSAEQSASNSRKRLGTNLVPRSTAELHTLLKEYATVSSAPFGDHDVDEELSAADAWYSLTMIAALELPDVPFHV